jgi:hypothetical protein
MAETLLSPGVFVSENDLSQITQGPVAAGAAIVGPTVTGPVNIPTLVTSYSQFKALFGASFISGGAPYEYLTSISALNYFEQGGDSLLVTRVASGSYTSAIASISNRLTSVAGNVASASFTAAARDTGSWNFMRVNYPTVAGDVTYTIYNYPYADTGSYFQNNTYLYVGVGSSAVPYPNNAVSSVSNWISLVATAISNASSPINNIYASGSTTTLTISAASAGTYGNSYQLTRSIADTPVAYNFANGTDGISAAAFDLETMTQGEVMNNSGSLSSTVNGALPSGSSANIRWEIVGADTGSGVFSLIIRRGDDYENNKTILESWNNISLDPNQPNYISYVIGDAKENPILENGSYYLQLSGSYANKSKYVRVKNVYTPTPNYLNQYGQPYAQYTSSIPVIGSGSAQGTFGAATGKVWGSFGKAPLNLFENIKTTVAIEATNGAQSNIQGIFVGDYTIATSLLLNKDAYDFNVIYAPGVNTQNAPTVVSDVLNISQNRGDSIAVIDLASFGQNMNTVIQKAQTYDNSYGAAYWPWVQISSRETGKINFVPASTLVPAVYEYNDKVSAEWFAPAGLNRGGMSTVLRPERRLSVDDRNSLYTAKVNPIATFPGVGTVIYGQKTLQSKASALDRVNVRRLLIALKRYIGQIGETIVFEPNTQVTRNKFLNQVNPYLESVQQRQGLYSFQVVMDETNNTPDVIDRNQLVGTIYLQPTRVAEFIQLDFNVLPTGTTFGA